VKGDAVIEIPSESRLQAQIILENGKTRETPLKPAVKIYYLELERATLKDSRDDLSRVRDALRCYEELDQDLLVDFEALRALPSAIRQADGSLPFTFCTEKRSLALRPERSNAITAPRSISNNHRGGLPV
jgi:uncharacterized 2Fe-2S/4Fe-4S cluster protein (DUF4445 family)